MNHIYLNRQQGSFQQLWHDKILEKIDSIIYEGIRGERKGQETWKKGVGKIEMDMLQ